MRRRLTEAQLDKIWKDFTEQFAVQGYNRGDLTTAHKNFHNHRSHVFFADRDRIELSESTYFLEKVHELRAAWRCSVC